MTAELEVAQHYSSAEVALADPTGGRLVAWAQAAQAAHQLAQSLSRTSFVPAAFKGNPADATAAVLMGDELGLSPLAALRSIFVVHGQPAMYARTMVALAQSRGHQIWTEKSSDTEVTVCGQRRGSDHVERATWSLARAQRAGYTTNKKYGSNPQEMLYAKAAAEVARKIAADVLAGVPHSVEELEAEPSGETVTAAPATRVARRKLAPVTVPEPDLEPAAEPDPAPDPDDPLVDPRSAQMKRFHALLNENGYRDRDDALSFIGSTIDRTVTSSKELTRSEASRVIDALVELSESSDDWSTAPDDGGAA